MIEGAVDLVTTENALGWMADRDTNEKWGVVAKLDGRIIGEGRAELNRPDLAAVGFGDGLCGFNIVYYYKIATADVAGVTVSPTGSNLIIPRTAPDSYVDLVQAMTKKYPMVGRGRSIHGGLWIDRTDAMPLLAGRVSVGNCEPSIFAPLRALIADGMVEMPAATGADVLRHVLDGGAAGVQPSARAAKEIMSALAPVFTQSHVAHFLKTVFDDVPVAYRPTVISDVEQPYLQAAGFETFSSPAETLVGYVIGEGEQARLDYVADSHELPEFGPGGVSRWTSEAAPSLPIIAANSQLPVRSHDIRPGLLYIVGPGLIHRVVASADARIVRTLFSPKRVTPLRFLSGETSWMDMDLGQGVRARL
jgi:hypothetical protein